MTVLMSHTIIGLVVWNSLLAFISSQNDTDCRQDVKAHMLCMRRNHDENKDLDDQTIRQAQDQIVQCFVE